MHTSVISLALSLASVPLVASHPGEDHAKEAMKRREFLKDNVANLNHCAAKLDSLGVSERSIQRRHNLIHGIREKRGIIARGEAHEGHGYDAGVDQTTLFSSNSSCVLSPEEILGPYYVAGESIRSNIVENQKGVPLHIDIQFINSANCEPIVGSYVDVWQANATGVYGGVVQQGFEDRNDTWEDTWGLTWLRGVQKTDNDGAVHFETVFPGHYEGRAIHIHALSHIHATPLPNNTLIDVHASHVGQMYFDQDLVDEVEKLAPYNTNQQPRTTNDEDVFLQGDLEAGGYPFMQYELIGDKLEDGILAWLSFGINATESKTVQPITTYHPRATEACSAQKKD
ncbi:hypothetical protein NLG97_g1776 [Lecanicillium saksenae]|uniref:Uncharacterized protein n=1 Tax=Lecanicillium saksenae TaxID=468837 RepID=A0ACC1R4N6_9HYPO|nr:hypothetical protein NLG97_g1776 [Lecanicillium saksenae]